MSISTRFRALISETEQLMESHGRQTNDDQGRALRELEKGLQQLEPFEETVGEIPQNKLVKELSQPLLRTHASYDRGRLMFEEMGDQATAAKLWALEQKIYRLLNDL
ncbi:MAG: hypothetical protein C0616_07375 [Desulfuromonas sp.]|nr:MAG: hypothetical protein C0616_07375 [Desulfuromonas sp.]